MLSVANASQNITFTHLGVSDGLPSSIVRQIIKDKNNMIWLATSNGLVNYDGYEINTINDGNDKSLGDIWSIALSRDRSLIIASITRGLFKYDQGKLSKLSLFKDDKNITSVFFDRNDRLWIGTDKSIYQYKNGNMYHFKNIDDEKIYNFIDFDDKHIFVTTTKNIYSIDIEKNVINTVEVTSNEYKKNYRLHKDPNGSIWLGREDGLYAYNEQCNCFEKSIEINESVYSFASSEKYLWIGTLYDGLYRYDFKTKKVLQISHEPNGDKGLSDNSILSIYYDQSGVLWIGTFYSGADYLNLRIFDFKIYPTNDSLNACSQIDVVHDILKTKQGIIWLATENGLIKIHNNTCLSFRSKENDTNSLSSNKLLSLYQSNDSSIWITNFDGGLDKLNPITNKIERLGGAFLDISFYFVTEYKPGVLLLGSFNKGLFTYNINNQEINTIKFLDSDLKDVSFNHFSIDKYNKYYFATNHGIAVLNGNVLEFLNIDINGIENLKVTSLSFDNNNNLWFGVNNQLLIQRNADGSIELINEQLLKKEQNLNVLSIVSIGNHLWVSSNYGIYKINTESHEYILYTEADGVLDEGYLINSFWHDGSEQIFFGGKTGIVTFNTTDLKINNNPPNVILTSFNYFNEELEIGSKKDTGFVLTKPINELSDLSLGYKDYIIGFEFAALDYADSKRNQYAYRLKGFNEDWVFVDANNRQATYTNLSSGEYIFQVMGSNKDGVWSEEPKELLIVVHPAPWFSPWAYFIYILTTVLLMWAFIRYKTLTSRKRTEQLEATVTERTQELNLQKKMVESLLDHKNEVFANITHEFKTPLALILGPTEQLVNEPDLTKHMDKLSMIKRNSQRLMLMVGQILKLSQAELDKEVLKEPQSVKSILLMLYESFLPLASNKNVEISLKNNHEVNIDATEDCVEIVVGNLISNALKFTSSGGHIHIESEIVDSRIEISVRDTGTGIDGKDLNKIFKRFARLETHKSIAGTGIGLSVVKEITEANDGQVKVCSEWGKGSLFTLIFPISDVVDYKLTDDKSELVEQLVENTENELKVTPIEFKPKTGKKTISILIIEDNVDMQTHIGSVLNNRFNCYFADRGRKGIAIALKEMPDIVICDVMMPGMDGYQVTRILRHDGRTSHIPIILLTALNTKESRIKGWRENIDTYITKPFDALELNVQIDNILNIRQILQKKTGIAIKTNSSSSLLELPKKDSIFIEKLQDVIGKYYTNEYFQKADLASKMAVSERHLHRKIKALVGESPMDMLRDYRLEKSAIKLKDGYQVGLASDECGFSSVSYFGSCFKKKYGITPKQYQKLNYKQ